MPPKKQPYYTATKLLLAFINSENFEYTNNAEISRAAGLKSARTAKRAISGEQVSSGTAKSIHRVCLRQGLKASLEESFDEVE